MTITVSGTSITFNDSTVQTTAATPGLGVGQTWQNVTGSRSLGTSYTNSTGYTIFVMINIGGGGQSALYLNGTQYIQAYSSGSANANFYFPVPNGYTYQCNNASLQYWSELR